MEDFIFNVTKADQLFSEALQRWSSYNEVRKEMRKVAELVRKHEELIKLPRKYKEQTNAALSYKNQVKKLGKEMTMLAAGRGIAGQENTFQALQHGNSSLSTCLVTVSESEQVEGTDLSNGEVLPFSAEYIPPARIYTPLDGAKELRLRDYQEELSQKSLRGENDIILLPTGTGKTYIAIQVIVEHLYKYVVTGKPKVLFFVPISDLAKQQLQKIKDYLPTLWKGKACTIIGEDSIRPEEMRELMVGVEYAVLVVTPAMVVNYFDWYPDASVTDFTLLIFDEFHHAKKDHPYNKIIEKCVKAKHALTNGDGRVTKPIPQMLGLTATIGIGDSTNITTASGFILAMCAKFGLSEPPSESWQQREIDKTRVDEKYIELETRRADGMSFYLQEYLMRPLETEIQVKLKSWPFEQKDKSINVEFPSDRHGQIYESYLVSLRDRVIRLHMYSELSKDVQYCKVALDFLTEYFRAMHLVSLLHCEHGVRHLEGELFSKSVYNSIEPIWKMFIDHIQRLKSLADQEDKEHPNQKVQRLRGILSDQFSQRPDSKVIIFVQMREVAQCLKDILNCNPMFKAKEFISTGPSADNKGMMPRERTDAREGFEGEKYNILVATSVLEEGIDIQACNMVIRYMYVKDMIAKVQSRGRARHESGVMIAMLDGKLLEQEERNNAKEVLMYKALDAVREMPPPEFQEEVRRYIQELVQPVPQHSSQLPDLQQAAVISCKSCGRYLGDMASVRKYCQSRFLIFDGQLRDRVTAQKRNATPMKSLDDLTPAAGLICKGNDHGRCNSKVGNLFKMSAGHYLGGWIIGAILLNGLPLKKYKDVSKHGIKILPIDARELHDLAREHSFPANSIQ
ncbi:ATP-dependent RNA helicase DHX58-like isoform X1 [Watersipora subatra]|uniref:ATP-dependent RNA helicase DHX58-like isoform X1 n=1 Tax=Watersipora subatra TaxID=2589382 RepID=UPI00355BC7B6